MPHNLTGEMPILVQVISMGIPIMKMHVMGATLPEKMVFVLKQDSGRWLWSDMWASFILVIILIPSTYRGYHDDHFIRSAGIPVNHFDSLQHL